MKYCFGKTSFTRQNNHTFRSNLNNNYFQCTQSPSFSILILSTIDTKGNMHELKSEKLKQTNKSM